MRLLQSRLRMGRILAIPLLMALAVAPASGVAGAAGVSSNLSSCDPSAPGSGQASLGRGGVVREPDLGQVHADLPSSAKGRAGPAFRASVPVYFHVVTDGATGSLTDAQIAAQMDVLNVTFAGGEGGARTGFSFRLAGVTRTDNADWFYAGPGGTDEHTMKRTLRLGGNNALNLYSTTAGAYLGWAYLPVSPATIMGPP
jgi:hypothetical protein